MIYYKTMRTQVTGLGDSMRIEVKWENGSVVWKYQVGRAIGTLGSFVPPGHANAAFNTGTLPLGFGTGAYFFQFGVESLHRPAGGWSAKFSCPAVHVQGVWSCVSHAETIQGDKSGWKALWRWGESFPWVGADPDPAAKSVTFHDSTSRVAGFVPLW